MSLLNLFWNLNVTDNTKYIIIGTIIVGILVLCFYSGNKKTSYTNNKITQYIHQLVNEPSSIKPTNCQKKYNKCMLNNIINGTDDHCYPCLNDGTSPDFFFNNKTGEWIPRT